MRSLNLFALTTIAVSAHHVKDFCNKGLCGGPATQAFVAAPPIPQTVVIPQLSSIGTAKPIFHQHGLIKVQLPPQQTPILAPSAITSAQQFAVGTPQLGRVVDRTEPTYFCKKPGFVLEGTTCVSTQVLAANLVCPGGFDNAGGACVRRAQILESCPVGYTRRQGHCAKLVSAPAIARCPPDSFETGPGQCTRRLPHPLTPTCRDGVYDARTGNCVVNVMGEAQAFCPEAFSLSAGGACLQEEVYDCSHGPIGLQATPQLGTISTVAMGPPPMLGKFGGHSHIKGRILHDKFKGQQAIGVPMATQIYAPPPPPLPIIAAPPPAPIIAKDPCVPAVPAVAVRVAQPCEPPAPQVVVQPTKTTVTVQKTCTRVTSTALVFACEQGVLQGQRCLMKEAVPADPVCTAQGDVTDCFTTVAVAPLQECPPDFSRECLPGRPCECVALEAAPFIQSCPSGFDSLDNGCARTAELRAVCPPGYLLQDDGQCLRVLREPADCVFSVTYECRPGDTGCLQ